MSPLIKPGYLKMEGGIYPAGLLGNAMRIERFDRAIEDWFHYRGCTFQNACYKKYIEAYKAWEMEWSTRSIEHQLSHHTTEDKDQVVVLSLHMVQDQILKHDVVL
ncbi:uncharacterized protein CIMG_13067 [Coccidioides immitis RS]|uniref:Uncharacterized protein n=1 Tax=Coccidioides immitis (strain RS) TaxID=246410 RepID=J3K8F5_COCIM|nr:uncharacterized protein CIMG_13067 [Coccidioides immitis RS]EAS31095.3 hypothetical protein CIMG_13067 [Coccidioides immitis RS]